MASPILHIKDSYYFEVPKFMWTHDFKTRDDVPKFLRDRHPHASVEDFERELAGKILIPQPFGTLKNLYEKESGFCLSKFMVIELAVAFLMFVVFMQVAKKLQSGSAPRGRFWNFFEAMLLFIRDEVARPAIDSHDDHDHEDPSHGYPATAGDHGSFGHGSHNLGSHAHEPVGSPAGASAAVAAHYRAKPEHEADKFVPLLWTIFFFVLFCNLFGMVPWTGAPTAAFAVTLGLAAITFATVLISGSMKFGPVGFWLNQVPSMDLPWYMAPLKVVIFVIEVAGMMIRHGILAVRLLANMVAGHVVLLGIMTLAFSVQGAMSESWNLAAPISVVASTLFSILELFVAFLQAYIFTFLSALFIGAANHHH